MRHVTSELELDYTETERTYDIRSDPCIAWAYGALPRSLTRTRGQAIIEILNFWPLGVGPKSFQLQPQGELSQASG